MIAKERECAVFAREIEDFAAVGTAIDEIAEEDDAVVFGEPKFVEELGKFLMAAVDVADGDEASVHAVQKC